MAVLPLCVYRNVIAIDDKSKMERERGDVTLAAALRWLQKSRRQMRGRIARGKII